MEEAAFLMTMQWIIGCIQVENEVSRWCGVGLQEDLDEQTVDGLRVSDDFLVACRRRGIGWCQLQTVEGTLAGQRLALFALS
jgi:hypothetical protein